MTVRYKDKHVLYRVYDRDDRLLYIGVTTDINARMTIHRSTTFEMFRYAHRVETEDGYKNYASAHEAEKAAIKAEMPWLNRQHNPRRWQRVACGWRLIGEPWTPPEPTRAEIESRGKLTEILDNILARTGATA